MICQRCHRPMQAPAAVVQTRSGRAGYGPKCAKAMGILPAKASVKVRRVVEQANADPAQMDWLQQVAA